jgi:hypothetical protein
MDLEAMSNAERWQEISEVMSFEVHTVEAAATGTAEVDAAVTIEAEAAPAEIAVHEPRTPRVVSISELRQRLGIEETPLARSAPLPTTGRPRIVKRREAEAYTELAAG